MSDYPPIIYKKHTFLSALVMGLSAITISILICGTVLIIYGSMFMSDKSDSLFALVGEAIKGLPKLQEALPSALTDVLDDRRDPNYASELDIVASMTNAPDQMGMMRTKIEIVNKGTKAVSLLCLRVVVLGPHDEILAESNEWAATPISAEQAWRGPILPGSHRYFLSSHCALPVSLGQALNIEIEITDLRVWSPREKSPLIEKPVIDSNSVGSVAK